MSAHDCRVGNNVIFSNNVMLAGHCTVGDFAILGGGAGVHQFARVGASCLPRRHVGAGERPHPLRHGARQPCGLAGLNIIGLKRRGFSRDDIHSLRRAYRLLFADEGTLVERLDDVEEETSQDHPIVNEIVAFISAGGKRSLCVPHAA